MKTIVEQSYEVNGIFIQIQGMFAFLLHQKPKFVGTKSKHGFCEEGSFTLSLEEAKLFVEQINNAIKEYEELKNSVEGYFRNNPTSLEDDTFEEFE